ncbi:LytTR family DNA-binding domain-containing protein [Chitinophagaceae bacterium 26-R-25]|nr:LytTR family DNA-binding domain-containing protein [Chitinophagaceae bacterium 26-R-25]
MEPCFFVRADKRNIRIGVKDISFIQSMGNYVVIVTNVRRVVTLLSIQQLAKFLPEDQFLQVHRSYIIALSEVSSFDSENVVVGGVTIPIGHNYHGLLEERFTLLVSEVRGKAALIRRIGNNM